MEIKTTSTELLNDKDNDFVTGDIISPEIIETPDYSYGGSQMPLDGSFQVRNISTSSLYAEMSASSNMTIPDSTDTTIVNMLNKSGNSAMTATDNQITITQNGTYLLSAYTFAGWNSTVVFRIMKNGVTIVPHYRSGTTSALAITPSITVFENLVKGDVLTLVIYQNSGGNEILQASRLSVLKI